MAKRSIVLAAVMAFGALFMAPAAQGAFGIANWEALTCKENTDTPANFGEPLPGFPPAQSPGQCTKAPASESKWFKQAAGHPTFGITDFTLNTFSAPKFKGFPEGFVKDIVVDTPEGLSVNPEATPVKCTVEQLKANPPECPVQSLVGANYLTVAGAAPPCEPVSPPAPAETCASVRVKLPVYNLVPFDGAPSMVGFPTSAPGEPTFIVGSLDPVDQHVTFTISDIHLPEGLTHPAIIGSRLVFEGKGGPFGDGTYLTNPSTCGVPQTAELHVDSHEGAADEASFTTPFAGEGCESVPFKPTIDVTADGPKATDSPEPTTVDVGIPFDASEPIANSYLKTAKVTLPEGMGINPSSANGLVPCTDAQFAKGTNDPITCPEASKIGTVEVQTPSLPPDSLGGTVYIGKPLKNGPGASSSGEQFRIFIHVTSARYGVNVRLVGKVFPSALTGQITAVVDENPQATFGNFRLHLNGGAKGTLTSPPTCGPNTTTTEMTPWSSVPDENKPTSSFTLTSFPGGGACPKTLAERKFAPAYTAKTDSTKAGAYSPFRVHIGRADGQQELKAVNVTLPKGLTGNLSGIPYCSEGAITAAIANSGEAEKANSSCPAASQLGTVSTEAGSGSAPFKITDGKAYLAGPFKGAPLSMVAITPAVAGPYDLGTVVVRVALNVNPVTAQINAVSDAIPDVFGGVKLDLRTIDVNVNRTKFMKNPTNCEAGATSGTINGGGGNPAVASAWQLLRRQRAVPGERMRQARLPAEAVHPPLRPDQAGEEPTHQGDPGSTRRRRQRGPYGADAAALAVPRAEPHQDGLHPAAAGLANLPEGGDLRPRQGQIAAAGQRVEGSGLPGVLRTQTAGLGRRPPWSGEHPAARRHQLEARWPQDRLRLGAGRAGEEVHPDDGKGQEEPARQLDQHLREEADGRAEHQGSERQEGQEQQVPPQHQRLQEAQEVAR